MQDLSSWTLEYIRKDMKMSWMEEKRFEWVSAIAPSIQNLVDAKSVLIITDTKREWLAEYIVNRINRDTFDRPLLPIIRLSSIFGHIDSINSDDRFQLLDDMLSLLFSSGYSIFYIGDKDDKRADFAKFKDNSMFWFLGSRVENGFSLNSKDERLDEKLLELVNLYDKSIDALLFGEVELKGSL